LAEFSSPSAAESQIALPNILSKGHVCMAWTAPEFEEIQLNCEINSYAGARL
jgi:coenzyme PQQ precursor peptide PqqA